MLGSNQGCGGPASWWCSEAWWCSPRISPGCSTTSARTTDMADCDQCNAKFSILKRKKLCNGCGLNYCSSCTTRSLNGARHCNKCMVLSSWPLNMTQVEALRVKDLRHFLHSQHINTVACTEKRDLIDLVKHHIFTEHGASTGSPRYSSTVDNSRSNFATRERAPYKPTTSPVTRDDGIRVRPCNITPDNDIRVRACNETPDNDINSMGSIRVRPMDSIRVRPGRPTSPDSNDYDPETDLGIRVFPSDSSPVVNQRFNTVSPTSTEGCSESAECSRCPSAECTTSCCSLDSCHNGGASSQPCPLLADNSSHCSLEDVSASSESHVASPELSSDNGRANSFVQHHSQSIHEGENIQQLHSQANNVSQSQVPTLDTTSTRHDNSNDDQHNTNENEYDTNVDDRDESLETNQNAAAATSPSSASSSTFPSESSSPEPIKQFGPGIVSLGDLKSEEDIRRLSVRQCKELLAFHRVNLSGVREKSELLSKIEILWKDYQNSAQDVDGLPEELVCKICMDRLIDCVFLECGHMVACTQCGKQMAECPMCRQFVVRVVRTFRA